MSKKNVSNIEFKFLEYSVPRISFSTERVSKGTESSDLDISLKGNLGIEEEKKYAKVELELDIKEKSDKPKLVLNMTMDVEYEIINGVGKSVEELSEALKTLVEKETVFELKQFVEKFTEMTMTNVVHLPL